MSRDAWRVLPQGPTRSFFERLVELWERNGMPTARAIAAEINRGQPTPVINHGTVSNMLNGPRLPTLEKLYLVVRYLGGDAAEFRIAWVSARNDSRPGGSMRAEFDRRVVVRSPASHDEGAHAQIPIREETTSESWAAREYFD